MTNLQKPLKYVITYIVACKIIYYKEDGDNDLDKSSGQIIMSLCEKEGITRNELARRLGISPSQISRIVNEETKTISSDILQLHLTGVVMTK